MKVLILDGYVDEPARLGVPPYLGPHARYLAGMLQDRGHAWAYRTVDDWRRDVKRAAAGPDGPSSGAGRTGGTGGPMDLGIVTAAAEAFHADFDVLAVIFGAVVPGTYLRTRPISLRECARIGKEFPGRSILLGPGVEAAASLLEPGEMEQLAGAYDTLAPGLVDLALAEALGLGPVRWAEHAAAGAAVAEHAWPHAVAEIDTYLGCHRYSSGGCSFCIEPAYGVPRTRPVTEIAAEVAALHSRGVRHFRLGGQSCILSYGASMDGDRIAASASELRRLLAAVRAAAPELRVLHVDNANPAVAASPEGRLALEELAAHCTPGGVLALGLESADPAVYAANNLNATADQVLETVHAVNRVGRARGGNGMPHLLPGINLLTGLPGERRESFELALELLRRIRAEGLWLRRIAIRSALPVRSRLTKSRRWRTYERDLRRFKETVREEIEAPILREMLPETTVVRDVLLEARRSGGTFGRQLGAYPLVLYFPYELPEGSFVDAVVTGYGTRSLLAIEKGLDLNTADLKALQAVPGIGRKRASRLVAARPFRSWEDLERAGIDVGVRKELRGYHVVVAGAVGPRPYCT